MRKLKGGRRSQAGEHIKGGLPRRRMNLDNSPDPYQKRTFFESDPTGPGWDKVNNGVQRKNHLS